MTNNFNTDLDIVLSGIKETLTRKRHDYGTRNISEFGIFGVLVRAFDKVNRLKTLTSKGQEVPDESTYDTWADLAGYAIIAILLLRGTYDKD